MRQREAEAAAAAERAKTAAAEQERRDAAARERAAAVAAQAEREAIYDIRCDLSFRTPAHAQAFMRGVTEGRARRLIPVEKQLEIAQQVRELIDRIEKDGKAVAGSHAVDDILHDILRDAVYLSKGIEAEELREQLRRDAIARVEAHWKRVTHYAYAFEARLMHLKHELAEWEHGKAAFPVDVRRMDAMVDVLEKVKELRNAIVGGKGDEEPAPRIAVRVAKRGPIIDL